LGDAKAVTSAGQNLYEETYLMTFNEFITNTTEGPQGLDEEFVTRLTDSGTRIESLSNLQRFCRERWPNQNPRDWRRSTVGMPYGREAMAALWARYLDLQEAVGAEND
jgi:hypothetical protein